MNNKMSVKLILIFLVLIQSILLSNNSVIADPLNSILTAVECEVTITPSSVHMELGDTQIFTASTTCNGDTISGTYTWSVDGGTLDTVHGDTVLYTATEEGLYTLVVTDTANHVTATATVDVTLICCVCPLDILPDTLLRSRWIMLPAWIIIESNCYNINFDVATMVEFSPSAFFFQMPKLVINNKHILLLLFLKPLWLVGDEDEWVYISVNAGGEEAFGFLDIEMLPFLLDEQKILK